MVNLKIIHDEKYVRNLIYEKELELEKIDQEAKLKESQAEQDVQKEINPDINELESYINKSVDKETIKPY